SLALHERCGFRVVGIYKRHGKLEGQWRDCCHRRAPAGRTQRDGAEMTLSRGVVAMCAAKACAQIGAFSVAAVLPALISAWALTNAEAGWISGIYYAAYTLTVPLLSSLTDRIDPKRVYLGSVALTAVAFAGFAWIAGGFWSALAFRALMGAGWAGSYMPGLKALSDLAEGQQ